VTTVESLADMTPEQLEEIPGIGPKTVEKISLAVNNYFSALDMAAAAEAGPPADDALPEDQPNPEAPQDPYVASAETSDDVAVEEPIEPAKEEFDTGQTFEGIIQKNVEDAPPADEAEVHVHDKHPGEDDIPPEKQ
jgi:N utilization substance protein A